jgi:ubiquinone/menaquinone biosynthesis C-methylase UbiE
MPDLPPIIGLKRVLHVGCGVNKPGKLHLTFRNPEWQEVRLDIDPEMKPDIVANMIAMSPVADGSMDAVWSSHNLEHLYAHEVPVALAEFFRALKPGGFVLITMPDLQKAAEYIAAGNLEGVLYESPAGPVTPIDIVFGYRRSIARGNTFMAHRTGFTADSLTKKLAAAGFHRIKVERDNLALWAGAYKPQPGATR